MSVPCQKICSNQGSGIRWLPKNYFPETCYFRAQPTISGLLTFSFCNYLFHMYTLIIHIKIPYLQAETQDVSCHYNKEITMSHQFLEIKKVSQCTSIKRYKFHRMRWSTTPHLMLMSNMKQTKLEVIFYFQKRNQSVKCTSFHPVHAALLLQYPTHRYWHTPIKIRICNLLLTALPLILPQLWHNCTTRIEIAAHEFEKYPDIILIQSSLMFT